VTGKATSWFAFLMVLLMSGPTTLKSKISSGPDYIETD
jgi:hypothetical protein